MLDTIKRAIETGLGAAALTREGIRKVLDKLVQDGKLTGQEAERIADQMVDEGKKELKKLQDRIASSVQKGLQTAGTVSREEFEQLKKRVEALERKNRPRRTGTRKPRQS